MPKTVIGFNRPLYRPWLDAAATLSAETDDPQILREQLDPIVAQDIGGVEARRKTVDLLINIWFHSRERFPQLWDFATRWSHTTAAPDDRLWLHYGLALAYYDFFRRCVVAVGEFGRYEQAITTKLVRERLTAELGALGSLPRSVARVIASLRNWGMLAPADQRYAYTLRAHAFSASDPALEVWLLAAALVAHPAEELPFADLVRLPELFPFQFTLTVHHLREHSWFAVQRQGAGWEMVRLHRPLTS